MLHIRMESLTQRINGIQEEFMSAQMLLQQLLEGKDMNFNKI